ncbi:MAG: glycosyltransferase family 1 protein [Candidatus Uhrbacteria bacterium]
MRIAVDGTTMRDGAGIGTYTRSVVTAMRSVLGTDLFVWNPKRRVPFLTRHVNLALVATMKMTDVLFCPANQSPLCWTGKTVVTVHDLTIYEHPEWFPATKLDFAAKFLVPRSLRRADAVIAISEATKRQIGRVFPDVVDKVVVVYPGVSKLQTTNHSLLTSDTILFVGTLEPRKNLVNALAAFDAFLRMHKDRAATTRFVIAGGIGWNAEPILEAIAQTNDAWRSVAGGNVVRQVGYVTEDEKANLYAQASCFFFPSWEEGFGLPVLEAMSAGVPVVTSNRGALPEVGGDAVMYVDPDDAEQMAFAIAQCVMMPEALGEMIAAAKARAGEFTWERCARGIVSIIEKV